MTILDASVLIAHLDASDAHHDRAAALLTATDDPLAASTLTLAEVLVAPARAGRLHDAMGALRRLAVRAVALDEDAPVRLATLRAGTGLKLPDCCVLLAAEQIGAAVATFDRELAAAARTCAIPVRT